MYPQDDTYLSALSGDTCPRCGGQLDPGEPEIGLSPGCFECHWTPPRTSLRREQARQDADLDLLDREPETDVDDWP